MIVQKASPILQKINVLLHTEPIATIAWGVYWIVFFTIAPFIVLPYVFVRTCINVILYVIGCNTTTSTIYQPKNLNQQYNLGIVITGCDTGFGKEIAFYTASLGYTVFAGCLHVDTAKEQFKTYTNIIPFQCDVTSDNDCTAASKLVSEWLSNNNNEKNDTDDNETKNHTSSSSKSSVPLLDNRKRYLFAIINNAGVDIPGETDTSKLSDFQFHMNGEFGLYSNSRFAETSAILSGYFVSKHALVHQSHKKYIC
jgi:short chain dehydrogenase